MIFYCNDMPHKEVEKKVKGDKLKQKEFWGGDRPIQAVELKLKLKKQY